MIREHKKEKSILPSGYTRLEYLESDGDQYIQAQYTCGRTLSYIDFHIEVYPIQQNINTIYGAFVGGGTGSTFELYYASNNNGWFSFYVNGSSSNIVYNYSRNTWYDVEAVYENSVKTLYIDNSLVSTVNANSTITMGQTPIGLQIFRYTSGERLEGRIKRAYVKMTGTGGTIEYDFVPALRISDNKPGFYDIINDAFYVNVGTREFQYA